MRARRDRHDDGGDRRAGRIAELAGILGCVAGAPDPITAITLVALGTSIADTLASKIAAQSEPTAESSITNVTGSNSVNAFVGLGVPWLCASVYWAAHGATDEWARRYPDVAARLAAGHAACVVRGGELVFSMGSLDDCISSSVLLDPGVVNSCVCNWKPAVQVTVHATSPKRLE